MREGTFRGFFRLYLIFHKVTTMFANSNRQLQESSACRIGIEIGIEIGIGIWDLGLGLGLGWDRDWVGDG